MFVMRDGQVRRPQLSDVKEVAERDERIRQLERQCEVLSAEVDRMRPVIDAAIDVKEHGCGLCEAKLEDAVDDYQASKPK